MNSQLRVMRTYLKARYRLSDLLRAQKNDRMTIILKRWVENRIPDKGDLEEDIYRILRQYFMQKRDFYIWSRTGSWLVREEKKTKSCTKPQLYQTELLFRSHDQMGHQYIPQSIPEDPGKL